MIGYYIHHQGHVHLTRAASIRAHLTQPVSALTSMSLPDDHGFDEVVKLPRDDHGGTTEDCAANGVLHWAPLHGKGLRKRMRLIADWVDTMQPEVVVTDVSVEVSVLVRLLGIPLVVIAMPGERTDPPHQLAYQLADHIVAAWPAGLYEPDWLRPHRHKTSYVGGITRFDGRQRVVAARHRVSGVLAMFGSGGSAVDMATIEQCAAAVPEANWRTLGVAGGPWAEDPWLDLCAADVVIAHAGQSSIADIAAAGPAAIVLPQDRPFGEQHATAAVLARERLAVVATGVPPPDQWRPLIEVAIRGERPCWRRWQTRGAARRAAAAIEQVARHRSVGMGWR